MIEPYDPTDYNDIRNRFDPSAHIGILWHVSDVQEVRPDLDDDKAMEVLKKAERHHDCNIGITWDILKFWANDLFPKGNADE